jgi:hypothetical protein
MVKQVLKAVGAGILLVTFSLMMLFTLINFMLNCQSWDEQYWTETSSCMTPSQFIGGFISHE